MNNPLKRHEPWLLILLDFWYFSASAPCRALICFTKVLVMVQKCEIQPLVLHHSQTIYTVTATKCFLLWHAPMLQIWIQQDSAKVGYRAFCDSPKHHPQHQHLASAVSGSKASRLRPLTERSKRPTKCSGRRSVRLARPSKVLPAVNLSTTKKRPEVWDSTSRNWEFTNIRLGF